LSAEPVLRIGKGREEEPYLFQSIMGAARLSDGSVVVMDWPSGEIRRFDRRGRYLLSFGGKGEGPGEFKSPRGGLRRLADTLVVLDSDGTVARFDPEGRLLGEIPAHGLIVRDEAAGGEWTDVSPDAVLWGARYPSDRERPLGRVYRPPYFIISSDTARDEVRVLGQYLLHADYEDSDRGRIGHYPVFFTATQPSRRPFGLLLGDNETFTIDLVDSEGTLLRSMRYPNGIHEADSDMVDTERQAWIRQYEIGVERGRPWDLPLYRRMILETPQPMIWPGFRGLIGDEEGYTWTLEYGPMDMVPTAMRDVDDPYEALVFHPDGHLLGSVELPGRFFRSEIGTDYVLGLEIDDLGVNELVLYELARR